MHAKIAQCPLRAGLPDAGRRLLAARLGETRSLVPEVAALFTAGAPGEVALADCTLLPEEALEQARHLAPPLPRR